jgi:hypothetical protein
VRESYFTRALHLRAVPLAWPILPRVSPVCSMRPAPSCLRSVHTTGRRCWPITTRRLRYGMGQTGGGWLPPWCKCPPRRLGRRPFRRRLALIRYGTRAGTPPKSIREALVLRRLEFQRPLLAPPSSHEWITSCVCRATARDAASAYPRETSAATRSQRDSELRSELICRWRRPTGTCSVLVACGGGDGDSIRGRTVCRDRASYVSIELFQQQQPTSHTNTHAQSR